MVAFPVYICLTERIPRGSWARKMEGRVHDAVRNNREQTMTRALVLGGGGPVGIAWESGLVAGLAQAGVDLGRADFTMGTSAGSFVGARLALGADPRTLADPIVADRIPGGGKGPAGAAAPPPGPL